VKAKAKTPLKLPPDEQIIRDALRINYERDGLAKFRM
jgi:hypothetical protein